MEGVGYPICESSRSQMLIMLMLSWEMCLLCQQLSWFIVSLQLNFSLFSVDHDLSLSHSKEPFGILLVITVITDFLSIIGRNLRKTLM